jgi:alpha-tubulin suppressor-like RCC1 family protein
MTNNPTGFKITDEAAGWNRADFDDVFVRKDCFLEGGLWLWGLGSSGQLGDDSVTPRSSPIQTISGGTNWRSVSAGSGSQTAAIKTDGTLWLWGTGNYGQLGNNAVVNQSSPIQTISGGTNWREVSSGGGTFSRFTAAIKTDGSLWIWGSGSSGELGDNSGVNKSSPVQTISGGTNWKSLCAGRYHTGAIKTDGTLWLWGLGVDGQLGNNAATTRSSPVQTISGGNNWKIISAGIHTVAIKMDGTLWTWGAGSNGALGTNSIISRSSPVQTISGGTSWRSASAGRLNTAAIKIDGSLWLWGAGGQGRLGNNDVANRSSPVQTVSGGTNWRNVSTFYHSVATKTDGTLWLWGGLTGSNNNGQLGDNLIINQSSPVQTISGGTNWRTASAGLAHTAAIREDCW